MKGHKNKKLITVFTERKLDYYKYRATKALEKYKMSKFYTVTINNNEFKIEYDLQKYQEDYSVETKRDTK